MKPFLDCKAKCTDWLFFQVLKAVVAEFDAGELITQRETVSQRVNDELTKRAGQFGVVLDDISITHLTFGR